MDEPCDLSQGQLQIQGENGTTETAQQFLGEAIPLFKTNSQRSHEFPRIFVTVYDCMSVLNSLICPWGITIESE